MTKKYRKFQDYLVSTLRDPKEAEAFLSAAIEAYEEDGDVKALMISLRYISEAKGGITALSNKTHLDRKNLYKILTGKTSPRFDTTMKIMSGLGYHLKLESIQKH